MKSISYIFVFLSLSFSALSNNQSANTVQVNGAAEVKVAPDYVILSIGVETFHESMDTGKSINDKAIKQILKLASKYNIPQKHFNTDNLNIEPRYKHKYSDPNLIGYQISKMMSITLKDISLFEKVLSDALKAGATNVYNVQFMNSELRKHRDLVRKNAMIAAKDKAIDLAAALDSKIGKPVKIIEGGNYNYYGFRHHRMMSQNSIQNLGGGQFSDTGTTAIGQISITANVNVSFELK
ncbi:MAG: SIMPL domain-containing protein [Lentisphaeria bacterium]|nr:SIMPL domain-containing protein [Lentisphaeria bacterium]